MALCHTTQILLFTLFSGICLVASDLSGSYMSPSGCTTSCDYSAMWAVDTVADTVTFNITCKQASGTWCAIGFGSDHLMQNTDVIYGYVNESGVGHVVDAWISSRFTPPVEDTTKSITEESINWTNGVYWMTFTRPRASTDAQDVSFTDTASYFFKHPVGGGPMSGTTILKHTNTPKVSSAAICVCAGPTTVMAPGTSMASTMMTGGSSMTPGESTMMPSGSSMMPGESTMMPSDPSMMPGESSMMPSGSSMMPGESSMMSSGSSMMPGESSMMPSGSSMMPGESSMMPSGSSMMPGESSMMPGGSSMMPGESSMMPGESTPMPGQSTMSHGGPSVASSNSTMKTTLIATLVTFGGLSAMVFMCFCFFTGPAVRRR